MKKLYSVLLIFISVTLFAQTYTFTTYNTDNSGIVANNVDDFKLSSSGTLWIATNNGLSAMVGENFTNYRTDNSTIPTNMLTKIAISGNNVWASTYQEGLVYRNGSSGAFSHYTMSNSGIPNNVPNGIATDGQGNLWMASSSGLTKFNGSTWTTYTTTNSQLSSNNVTSVAVDAANNVWISAGGMLQKFAGNSFTSITDGVMSILKVTTAGIYVNTGDGLGKIVNNDYTDIYWTNSSCLGSCTINAVGLDETNKVWLGLDSCGNYAGGVQNFTNCTTYTTSNSALPHNSITSLHVVDSNVIWAGTLEGGLVRMNKTDGPVCNPPTQPYVAQFGQTTAYLAWTAASPAPANGYLYLYNTTNSTSGGIQSSTAETGAGIDQLTPGTVYYWWVASVCEPLMWVPGGSFTTEAAPACTTATYGLFPETTFTPACSGSNEQIVTNAWAGEYTNVNVLPGKEYTFISSAATDYITITNAAGTTVMASGQTPLIWTSGTASGVIRYFMHSNADCGSQNTSRTRSIKCVTVTAPSCGVPTALSVSNITSNSSRLNWTAPATAPVSYDLYIVTTNTAPVVNTLATVTSNTAGIGVLSGLAPSTTYYYWIRSNCGSTKSAWVSGGSFSTISPADCNGAGNGLYPEATFTPACTGSNEQIVADAYAGEYSNVNVTANKQYTFTSSVATDYITIANANGTIIYGSGQTPFTWSSGTMSGVIRYHLHTNAGCGIQNTARVRSIKCVNATASCAAPTSVAISNITSNSARVDWVSGVAYYVTYDIYYSTSATAPVAGTTPTLPNQSNTRILLTGLTASTPYYFWIRTICSLTSRSEWVPMNFTTITSADCNGAASGLYPEATFTPACTGSNEQISPASYAGEYSNVNVVANKQYTFTSSTATDYITITNANGTIIYGSGQTPFTWSSGTMSGVIRYHLHTNTACGTQNSARVRSIKCVDAPASCAVPTSLAVSNITSNSVRVDWVSGVTYNVTYDIYYSASAAAPVAGTTPTVANQVNTRILLKGLTGATTYYFWIRTICSPTSKSEWVLMSFTTIPTLTCNGATNGLYPEVTFTPACTGSNEVINNDGFGGDYSRVNVVANKQLTFSSSIATDYITVTNTTGTVVYASGQTPVVWLSGTISGIVRAYLHTNASCGDQNTVGRTRYVKCADAPVAVCAAPSALAVSNITSNSCRITWAEPVTAPSNYDVYINSSSTWPEYNANPTASPMSAILVSYAPLAASTTYHYWVRSVCGSVKSDWVSGGSFTTLPALVCNGAEFGLYPEDTITLQNSGASEPVAFQALAGQYSNVIVAANKQYQFESSVSTDYITVTNAAGTVLLASGTTPLNWLSGSTSQAVRFYLHANANCGADDFPRNKFATSGTLGIGEIERNPFNIYPNPSSGRFTIDTGNNIPDGIVIYDNMGRIVSTHKPEAAKTTIVLDQFSDGIYYVKVYYQDQSLTGKLVLKKH